MKWEDCWRSSALCICRRISVQGISTAVVPLFIFNHTRKKNVIMACLPQSPPCLWVFELFEIKASGNVALSDSEVHPRADQKWFCPNHSAVSIWERFPAELSPVQRNTAITNSVESTKTWSKLETWCFLLVFFVHLTAQSDHASFPLNSWLFLLIWKHPHAVTRFEDGASKWGLAQK